MLFGIEGFRSEVSGAVTRFCAIWEFGFLKGDFTRGFHRMCICSPMFLGVWWYLSVVTTSTSL